MYLEAPAVGKRGATFPAARRRQRGFSSGFCLPIEPDILAKVFQKVALFPCGHETNVLFYVLDRFSRIELPHPWAVHSGQRPSAYELG